MLDEKSPVSCLYNGNEVIRYDGFNSVTIQTLNRPASDYLFDPRLLGITTSCSWSDSLATALPHREALELRLVGRESVGSVMTWHVQAVDKFKRQIDMWIDESKNLQIHWYCLLKTNLSSHSRLFTIASAARTSRAISVKRISALIPPSHCLLAGTKPVNV